MTEPPNRPRPREGTSSTIAIVVSRYSASITDRLLEGAVGAYVARGGSPGDLSVLDAPGSFELPVLCHAAAASGQFAGVVALGCIIKGQTPHDQHLASAVTHGLVSASIQTGVPITLGVLTVNNAQQARERAGGKFGNKGEEAMHALLLTIDQLAKLRRGATGSGVESGTGGRRAPSSEIADKAISRKRSGGTR